MSYIISIRPVLDDKLKKLVVEDEGLSLQFNENFASLICRKDEQKIIFNFSDNEITSLGTPIGDELEIMQDLAFKLDAKLIGEEGEDLTGSFNEKADTEGCGTVTLLMFRLLIIAILYYWIFFKK